jgi:hypothetical protein
MSDCRRTNANHTNSTNIDNSAGAHCGSKRRSNATLNAAATLRADSRRRMGEEPREFTVTPLFSSPFYPPVEPIAREPPLVAPTDIDAGALIYLADINNNLCCVDDDDDDDNNENDDEFTIVSPESRLLIDDAGDADGALSRARNATLTFAAADANALALSIYTPQSLLDAPVQRAVRKRAFDHVALAAFDARPPRLIPLRPLYDD